MRSSLRTSVAAEEDLRICSIPEWMKFQSETNQSNGSPLKCVKPGPANELEDLLTGPHALEALGGLKTYPRLS